MACRSKKRMTQGIIFTHAIQLFQYHRAWENLSMHSNSRSPVIVVKTSTNHKSAAYCCNFTDGLESECIDTFFMYCFIQYAFTPTFLN